VQSAKKGFTLVEVMIVVVIIGILAALIVPRMASQIGKARLAEALQMFGTMKRGLDSYCDRRGSYPIGYALWVPATNSLSGNFGNFLPLGITDANIRQSKNFSYDYNSYTGQNPMLTATSTAPLTDTANYAKMVFGNNSGTEMYTCAGLLTNGGDSTKPCWVK